MQGNTFIWGLFNPTGAILTRRYDKQLKQWRANRIEVNIETNFSDYDMDSTFLHRDGLDSLYNESSFSFIVDEKIDITKNDAFEFTFKGEKNVHLITDFNYEVFTVAPLTYRLNIKTLDYTAFLKFLPPISLSFPKSNEWGWNFGYSWASLYDVVERIRRQCYIQPQDGFRDTFVMYDGYTEKLETKLKEYSTPPELFFKSTTVLQALEEIFSLINGRPFIRFDEDNNMLLDILEFTSTEEQITIPIEECSGYAMQGNNANYATTMRSEVDNITGDYNLTTELLRFTGDPGRKNEAGAKLTTSKPIRRVIDATLYRLSLNANQPTEETMVEVGSLKDRILPSAVRNSLNPLIEVEGLSQSTTVSYEIKSNDITGFGDSFKQTDDGEDPDKDDITYVKLFQKLGENNASGLHRYQVLLTYETLSENEFVDVDRDDIEHINNISVLQTNQQARQVNFESLTNKMLNDINMRGSDIEQKIITYTNMNFEEIENSNVPIFNLLARDTESGKYISAREFKIDGNQLTVSYTLVSEYNFIPDFINVDTSARPYGIDIENAILRPINYKEYIEVDFERTRYNRALAPSITRKGIKDFMDVFASRRVQPSDLSMSSYYTYDDNTNILLVPSTPVSGIDTNKISIRGRDPIYIGDRIRVNDYNESAIGQLASVPYTNMGVVDKVGLNFVKQDYTKLPSNLIPDLPEINTTQFGEYKRIQVQESLFSLSSQHVELTIEFDDSFNYSKSEEPNSLKVGDGDTLFFGFGSPEASREASFSIKETKVFDSPVYLFQQTFDDIEFSWNPSYAKGGITVPSTDRKEFKSTLSDFIITDEDTGAIIATGTLNSSSNSVDPPWFSRRFLLDTFDYYTFNRRVIHKLSWSVNPKYRNRLTPISRIKIEGKVAIKLEHKNGFQIDGTISAVHSSGIPKDKLSDTSDSSEIYNNEILPGSNTKLFEYRPRIQLTIPFVDITTTSEEDIANSRFLSIQKVNNEIMDLGIQQDIKSANSNIVVGRGLARLNPLFNQFSREGDITIKTYASESLYAKNNKTSVLGHEISSQDPEIESLARQRHPILGDDDENFDGDITTEQDNRTYEPSQKITFIPQPSQIDTTFNTYRSIALVAEYEVENENGEIITHKELLVAINRPEGFTTTSLRTGSFKPEVVLNWRSERNGVNLNWNPYRLDGLADDEFDFELEEQAFIDVVYMRESNNVDIFDIGINSGPAGTDYSDIQYIIYRGDTDSILQGGSLDMTECIFQPEQQIPQPGGGFITIPPTLCDARWNSSIDIRALPKGVPLTIAVKNNLAEIFGPRFEFTIPAGISGVSVLDTFGKIFDQNITTVFSGPYGPDYEIEYYDRNNNLLFSNLITREGFGFFEDRYDITSNRNLQVVSNDAFISLISRPEIFYGVRIRRVGTLDWSNVVYGSIGL